MVLVKKRIIKRKKNIKDRIRHYENTVLRVINKQKNRRELSRKRENVLGSGPDYQLAKQRLGQCYSDLRCGLSACVECAHQFRLKYIISALRAFENYPVMYHVTILDRIVDLDELGDRKNHPANITQRLKRILAKNGFSKSKIFGSIEFSYENMNENTSCRKDNHQKGRFILHYHLVFIGELRNTLESLRNCFNNRSLKRHVLIQAIKNSLEDQAKVFSYCCKRVDYYRPKIIKNGQTSYSNVVPMPAQYRRVLLNYLSKYRMSELQLHYNVPFTGGVITDGGPK